MGQIKQSEKILRGWEEIEKYTKFTRKILEKMIGLPVVPADDSTIVFSHTEALDEYFKGKAINDRFILSKKLPK